MNEPSGKKRPSRRLSRSPQALLALGFLGLIAVGTLLLWLPLSHRAGTVGLVDALFTSTSAVCVTGLVVVDTGRDFNAFGQIVILLLIQTGGLGVMTFAALTFRMFAVPLSLASQTALRESFAQGTLASEFRDVFWKVLRLVAAVEAAGAALLFAALLPGRGVLHALGSALFHSVSAFCNAGFSLYTDSLTGHRGNALFVPVVLALIVLGGLGHTVLLELAALARRRPVAPVARRLSFHARVVLLTSGLLVAFGFAGLLVLGLTPGEESAGARVSGALFQSVTARTAGFNTVDVSLLPPGSLFLLVLLMFVGGSPGSCAGGVKTTSVAIWLARVRALLLGSTDARILHRRIPQEVVSRVFLLLSLALLWNAAGLVLLLATEGGRPGASLGAVLFEQISAFGTVGLSTGLTPGLSTAGRLWIILTMFVGRLGPLTLATWIVGKETARIRYPEGRVLIG